MNLQLPLSQPNSSLSAKEQKTSVMDFGSKQDFSKGNENVASTKKTSKFNEAFENQKRSQEKREFEKNEDTKSTTRANPQKSNERNSVERRESASTADDTSSAKTRDDASGTRTQEKKNQNEKTGAGLVNENTTQSESSEEGTAAVEAENSTSSESESEHIPLTSFALSENETLNSNLVDLSELQIGESVTESPLSSQTSMLGKDLDGEIGTSIEATEHPLASMQFALNTPGLATAESSANAVGLTSTPHPLAQLQAFAKYMESKAGVGEQKFVAVGEPSRVNTSFPLSGLTTDDLDLGLVSESQKGAKNSEAAGSADLLANSAKEEAKAPAAGVTKITAQSASLLQTNKDVPLNISTAFAAKVENLFAGNAADSESAEALTKIVSSHPAMQQSTVSSHAAMKPQIPVNIHFGRPEWAGMVAERSAMMAAQSIKFAELQLDPPELGPLQVKVSVNQDNQATVTFVSANAQVREALDQSANRLRELLQEQGVDLMNVDVSDHSSSDTQEGKDGEEGSNGSSGEGDLLEENETTRETWMVNDPNVVDYYA